MTERNFPGHSLDGEPCRCEHSAPAPAEAEQRLRCPRCGAGQFTYMIKPYGLELACYRCPTFIGVKLARCQPQDSSVAKRLFGWLRTGLELGDER
jgi:hypothetical protein